MKRMVLVAVSVGFIQVQPPPQGGRGGAPVGPPLIRC
jgi:hypothetical protein